MEQPLLPLHQPINPHQRAGAFGQNYNDAAGLFGIVAGGLRKSDTGMDVQDADIQQIRGAGAQTRQILTDARTKLPGVREAFLGSRRGQYPAWVSSALTLLVIFAPVIKDAFGIVDAVKNDEDIAWGSTLVNTGSALLTSITVLFWWRHSANTKVEAQYSEANPVEYRSVELMANYLDAAKDLGDNIQNTPANGDGQARELRRLHDAYMNLGNDQQLAVGSLTEMKLLYLRKIEERLTATDGHVPCESAPHPVHYENNELIKIYNRVRVLAAGLVHSRQAKSQPALGVAVHGKQQAPLHQMDFCKLQELAHVIIDAGRGVCNFEQEVNLGDSVTVTLGDLFTQNYGMTNLWLATEWFNLERYIKQCTRIPLGNEMGNLMHKAQVFDQHGMAAAGDAAGGGSSYHSFNLQKEDD